MITSQPRKRIILGHRGALINKENSLDSILSIKKYNNKNFLYGVELDIQINNEDKLVCFHDETLSRIYNYHKILANLTDDELKKFNITTLDVIINEYSSDHMLNIELKIYGNKTHDSLLNFCKEVINTLDKRKDKNIILSSFNQQIIKILLSLKLNFYKIGYIVSSEPDDIILENMVNSGLNFLIICKEMLQHHQLNQYNANQLSMNAYIKNKYRNIKILIYSFFENKLTYGVDKKLIHDIVADDAICNIGFITDSIDIINSILT
jgi:hypothetical protein